MIYGIVVITLSLLCRPMNIRKSTWKDKDIKEVSEGVYGLAVLVVIVVAVVVGDCWWW